MECQTVLSYINAKTPSMGIVPTQWNHKTSYPMYKTRSKRKMNIHQLRIWNINCNSTVQMTSNWYWKLKMVQQTKWARNNGRTTKNSHQKRNCFNINVTHSVESVNTSNNWCPRLIKRKNEWKTWKNGLCHHGSPSKA